MSKRVAIKLLCVEFIAFELIIFNRKNVIFCKSLALNEIAQIKRGLSSIIAYKTSLL